MSETALAKRDDEMVSLVKETVCKGATDTELRFFLASAERLGLDPLGRQIYSVARWSSQDSKMVRTIQVSIDGFRAIADRTGAYAGQLGPFFCGPDAAWLDVWLANTPPSAAKVGILHKGFAEPLWHVALWREYAPLDKDGNIDAKRGRFWKQMPALMLAKCCEAAALRRAFPAHLSGVYSPEEMAQASEDAVPAQNKHVVALPVPVVKPVAPVTVVPEPSKAPSETAPASAVTDVEVVPLFTPPSVPPVVEPVTAPATTEDAKATKHRREYYRLMKDAGVVEDVAGGFGKACAKKTTSKQFTSGDWADIAEQLNLRIDLIRYGCGEPFVKTWNTPWDFMTLKKARDVLATTIQEDEC